MIKNVYRVYKLIFSDEKSYVENPPFMRKHMWVQKTKNLISKFSNYSLDITLKANINEFDNLLQGIRSLVVDYENHKRHIISYTITSLENIQEKFLDAIEKLKESGEINIIYLLCSKYIDLITQIVSLSIGYDNIVKLCRMYMKFIKTFDDVIGINIEELIYKKSYLLLNYNRGRWTELQNLLLVLSRLQSKNLPPEFLLDVLKNDKGYLSVSVIAYYIRKLDKKIFYYKEVYNQINNIIKVILDDCSDIYGFYYNNNRIPDSRSIDKFIQSDKLYIIHDFYSSDVLDKENIEKINKIKSYVIERSNQLTGNKAYDIFLKYIKGFDKPFIRWDINDDDLLIDFFLQKQYKNIKYD